MSYIPAKAMHHAHVHDEPEGTGGGELGGVPDKIVPRVNALGWILGAAGAGIAVATVAGLLSLRSSSPKPPVKRRAGARKTATRTGRASPRRVKQKSA